MSIRFFLAAATVAMLGIFPANAELTITSRPTKNVDCSGGVCAANAKHANLNADDLVNLLGSGDVTVTSGHKAKDIEVATVGGTIWSSGHHLTLDAFRSIVISRRLYDHGNGGGLTLTTNDGGSGGVLSFVGKGAVNFADADSNTLVINGETYKLISTVHSVASLAGDISTNPAGNFALPISYNAGVDGVYTHDPITTIFLGKLQGLGNAIVHLHINSHTAGDHVGLFYAIDGATVSDLKVDGMVKGGQGSSVGLLAGLCQGTVANVEVSARVIGGLNSSLGGICGVLDGDLTNAHSSGSVTGDGDNGNTQNDAGGLVGIVLGGTISRSFSTANVTGAKAWTLGGLAGRNQGSVDMSYATGVVSVGDNGVAGGLVGNNIGATITNSYATGFTGGGVNSTVGGLLGTNNGPVSDSYSSGSVASGSGNAVGGFVGNDIGSPDLTDTYWDITTSGQSHGAGNITSDPGITGLTTEEFQAGLPSGFDPSIWAETPDINGGLPYLLALAPN